MTELTRHDEALTAYQKALELGTPSASLYTSLGYLHYYRQDLAASRDAFQQAIALAPDAATPHNNLAYVEILSGNVETAVPLLERAIELNHDFVRAYYNRGLCAWLQEQREEATSFYAHGRVHDQGEAEFAAHRDDLNEVRRQQEPWSSQLQQLAVLLDRTTAMTPRRATIVKQPRNR